MLPQLARKRLPPSDGAGNMCMCVYVCVLCVWGLALYSGDIELNYSALHCEDIEPGNSISALDQL